LKLRLHAAVFITLILAWFSPKSVAMSRDDSDAVRWALNRGKADAALKLLDSALDQNASDAEALNFRCRVFYAEERWDDAIAACERSVQIAPGVSSYHMWLARAYGEKADRVNFVTAYKMAKLIRAEFESAASLDPRNGAALSDLGEYYVEAPAFLGGGTNKAEGVARQLDGFSPVRAHDLRARIAENKTDYVTAEKEFRAKISAAAHTDKQSFAQAWMDLGSFYRRRGRLDAMQAVVQSGAIAATDHGSALVDGASNLMRAGRNEDMAAEWMRQYLSGDALSEDAPAFVVHKQLGDYYKGHGDARRAEQEYTESRALASGFGEGQPQKTNTGR
jgi:tetratricopeptide (TPR) repeat protein